jgi:hypothetical protein
MPEWKFVVQGNQHALNNAFLQPSREGRRPLSTRGPNHLAMLLGLTGAPSSVQLREAHVWAGKPPGSDEQGSPCLRSPDLTDPLMITSANCTVCMYRSMCSEETVKRRSRSTLAVHAGETIEQEEWDIVKRLLQRVDQGDDFLTFAFPSQHPFELLNESSDISEAILIAPEMGAEHRASSAQHLLYSHHHKRTLSLLEARWIHELEALETTLGGSFSGASQESRMNLSTTSVLPSVARMLLEFLPSVPCTSGPEIHGAIIDHCNVLVSEQARKIGLGTRPRGFNRDQTPSLLLLNAFLDLEMYHGTIDGEWPDALFEHAPWSGRVNASRGSWPSQYHHLAALLFELIAELGLNAPNGVPPRDIFGRRLRTVVIVPADNRRCCPSDFSHPPQLDVIREVFLEGITRPLYLIEHDARRHHSVVEAAENMTQPSSIDAAIKPTPVRLLEEMCNGIAQQLPAFKIVPNSARRRPSMIAVEEPNTILFEEHELREAVHLHLKLHKFAKLPLDRELRKRKSALNRLIGSFCSILTAHSTSEEEKNELRRISKWSKYRAIDPDYIHENIFATMTHLAVQWPRYFSYEETEKSKILAEAATRAELKLQFKTNLVSLFQISLHGDVVNGTDWKTHPPEEFNWEILEKRIEESTDVDLNDDHRMNLRSLKEFCDAGAHFRHRVMGGQSFEQRRNSGLKVQRGVWLSQQIKRESSSIVVRTIAGASHVSPPFAVAFLCMTTEVEDFLQALGLPADVQMLERGISVIRPVRSIDEMGARFQLDPFDSPHLA